MNMFKKASRSESKLKLAITGPSGSGKTYSALLLAKGLGGKIAVIDSENGSAALYAQTFDFDTMTISPPYTTEKYNAAINGAVDAGYDVVIVDSITHAWSGEGGLLSQKEQLDARGGNSYTNWAKITPKHEAFIGTILHSKIHVIATMRSKQDYVLSDRNGKQVPQKVGMAPVQRDGAEYEFTVVLDVAMNHEAQASKDRTGLFDGQIFKISEKTGQTLKAWLNGAVAPAVRMPVKTMSDVEEEAAQETKREMSELAKAFKAQAGFRVPVGVNQESTEPGDYIAQCGRIGGPIMGKVLKDIDEGDLMGFMQWLRRGGKDGASQDYLSQPEVQEFIFMAEEYLNEKKRRKLEGGV